MKMPALIILWIVAGVGIAHAAGFEREGWPGEGVPAFSAKHATLRLNESPSKGSEEITLPSRIGETISYDRSRVVTKGSVPLTAREVVADASCPGAPVPATGQGPIIQPGETIEYLQYLAEGYIVARYKGVICEVFIGDDPPSFDGLEQQPEVEWWIRVVSDEQNPLGWLLIDEDQVNYLPRGF